MYRRRIIKNSETGEPELKMFYRLHKRVKVSDYQDEYEIVVKDQASLQLRETREKLLTAYDTSLNKIFLKEFHDKEEADSVFQEVHFQ